MPPFQSKGGKQVARDYPMSDAERQKAKDKPGKASFKFMMATKPSGKKEIPSGGLKKGKKKVNPGLRNAAKRKLAAMQGQKKNGN